MLGIISLLTLMLLYGDAMSTGCKNCMQAPMSKEERAMFRVHSAACLPQSNADPSTIDALLAGELRDEPALRHHVYCVLRKCKIIGKDGKLQKTAVLGKMARVIGGKNSTKVIESCSEQSGDTPEDLAWNLFRCGYDNKTILFDFMPSSAPSGDNDNDN